MSDSPSSSATPPVGVAALPPRRKRSPRFVDIAALAGVSPATVNRVLNERGSVSPEMRAKVVAAAKQLGVPRVLPDPRHGLTRFDVVLADSPTPYFRRLERALQRATQTLDPRILIHRHQVSAQEAPRVIAALSRPGRRCDGLMVALQDSAAVRDALRGQLGRGVPVVTVMSPVGGAGFEGTTALPLHYAGIDNLQAGRTAGHFIGRLVRGPGRVLLLTNDLDYQAHAQRIQGCQAILAQRSPQLSCSVPVTCRDDPDQAQWALTRALKAAEQAGEALVGLYHSGAGSTGVAAVLQRLTPTQRPVWVGHEISDEHRTFMQLGLMDLVIDQDPDGQVQAALHYLLHATGYIEQPAMPEPNEFRLFCPENVRQGSYLPVFSE